MITNLIESLFGAYVPISYVNADGVSVIPDGLSGVNPVWVFGAFLFALTFYSVFRLVGVLLDD